MHTKDFKHQKGYALRYIWKNYMRKLGHTVENIHKGHYCMLGEEYRKGSVKIEATRQSFAPRE